MNRRVVVTGLGVVTSIGVGKNKFWKNLISGKSGISEVSEFYTSIYSPHCGGPVKEFESGISKDLGRASRFAIEGTREALKDAGLSDLDVNNNRTGAIFGTTNGESNVLEEIDRVWIEKGEEDIWARTIVKYPIDSISKNVAYYFNIGACSQMIPTACAAGNYSIGYAYDLISTNRADIMIAGGSDPLTRYAFAGFSRLLAMAPEKCQPFDRNRKGMIIGEGAGVLVLEELESARKRKAPIYCEIIGYGLSCDASHMTAPKLEGIKKVMEKAIKNSGIKKEDVDYICAHGTGTPSNDKVECQAIKEVLGDSAKDVLVSSIKSMLGHTMGAASAIEAVACCLAIKYGIVPPTINYKTPDPDCDIDCVPNESRKKELKIVINNSFAFGGNNACLVIKKFNG